MEKRCTKCDIKKNLEDFQRKRESRDGLKAQCKACISIYSKNYHDINKDKLNKQSLEYRKENIKKMLEYGKKYREENRESLRMGQLLIGPRREQRAKYREKNRESINKYNRTYLKRKKKESFFKFKYNIRGLLKASLTYKGFTKKSKTAQILGCSFEELQNHLRNTFELNYGIPFNWVGVNTLHIDHVIPLATAKTEEEVLKLNHYSNLQYLFAEDNLRKGANLDWELKWE